MKYELIDIVFVMLMIIVCWFLITVGTNITIKDDTQCWTNTIPKSTATWHPIACPKGVK